MSHEAPRHWRLKDERYRLVGERCPHCSGAIFPPRELCPNCGKNAKEKMEFSGKGRVYSYTKVLDAPNGYKKQVPYLVALVELEKGPLVTAQLTDISEEEVEIGMPVEMVTRILKKEREKGPIVYGYKFRPPLPATGKRAA